MDIDDMQLFVEVVKAKGFTAASNNLNIPKSTISVRINRLEQQIGLRLLNRNTRRIELTQIGEFYFKQAAKIVEETKTLHNQLDDLLHNPIGQIRLSLPVDFAYEWLVPWLGEFHQRYPQISFTFDVTPRKIDLLSNNIDIAIRTGLPDDSGMIGHLLTHLHQGMFASPDYLEKNGNIDQPNDLSTHQCLQQHNQPTNQWHIYKNGEEKRIKIQSYASSNSVGLNMRLAMAHQGIAILPIALAQRATKVGRLQRVLPEWQNVTVPIYALTATRLLPAKTRVFIDFLKEKLN